MNINKITHFADPGHALYHHGDDHVLIGTRTGGIPDEEGAIGIIEEAKRFYERLRLSDIRVPGGEKKVYFPLIRGLWFDDKNGNVCSLYIDCLYHGFDGNTRFIEQMLNLVSEEQEVWFNDYVCSVFINKERVNVNSDYFNPTSSQYYEIAKKNWC